MNAARPRYAKKSVLRQQGNPVAIHRLKKGDVFEFGDVEAAKSQTVAGRLRVGRLVIVVQPWGPRGLRAAPIGPWMFACKDDDGRFHHYAVDPQLTVRQIET